MLHVLREASPLTISLASIARIRELILAMGKSHDFTQVHPHPYLSYVPLSNTPVSCKCVSSVLLPTGTFHPY